MMASVGSLIVGSGTSSMRTSRVPCHVKAFMVAFLWIVLAGPRIPPLLPVLCPLRQEPCMPCA